MAIPVTCPKCTHTLKVRDELAGGRGRCPKCNSPVLIPLAPTAATAPPEPVRSAADVREQVLGSFQGTFHAPAVSLARKAATWLVLAALLGLVLVYVAVLAALAWVTSQRLDS